MLAITIDVHSRAFSLQFRMTDNCKSGENCVPCLQCVSFTAKISAMYDVKDSELINLEEDDFDTVLERDITFRGSLKFKKPFMIRGTVSGSIDATSDLVIDTGAEVTAMIAATRVVVKGKVEGNITAKKIVIVTSSGMVEGDITSEQVVLEPGSHFSGRCSMTHSSTIGE